MSRRVVIAVMAATWLAGHFLAASKAQADDGDEIVAAFGEFSKRDFRIPTSVVKALVPRAEAALRERPADLAYCLNEAGVVLERAEDLADAEKLYARALALNQAALGGENSETINSANNLANVYAGQKRFADADRFYRWVLEMRQRTLGAENAAVADTLAAIGENDLNQEKWADSEAAYNRAGTIYLKVRKPDEAASMLNGLGTVSYRQGRYADAEKLYRQSMEVREKVLGPDNSLVALSARNVAQACFEQRRYGDAVPLFQRALAIYEKLADKSSAATTLQSCGDCAYRLNKYAEARAFYERAFEIHAKLPKTDPFEIAFDLNCAADCYTAEAKYADAEPLLVRALEIREKLRGAEHVDVMSTVVSLAGSHLQMAHYDKAEALYERAKAVYEKAGKQADVASMFNQLGVVRYRQGRYADALTLYKQCLAIQQEQSGVAPSAIAQTLQNLAETCAALRQYDNAEKHYGQLKQLREKAFGADSAEAAQTLESLAGFYTTQNRYADAENQLRQALALRQKKLGPEHADVAATLTQLAYLYEQQSRNREAESYHQQALAMYEKTLGEKDAKVVAALNNLATLYVDQGKFAEAEPLLERARSIAESDSGEHQRQLVITLRGLARLCLQQGRHAEAEPLYRQTLEIVEKLHGHEHAEVAGILASLASMYESQRRHADAETFYKQVLAIQEKTEGQASAAVADTLEALAAVYQHLEKYNEARTLRLRAATIKRQAPDAAGQSDPRSQALTRGDQLMGVGDYPQAAVYFRQALEVAEEKFGNEHPQVASDLYQLACARLGCTHKMAANSGAHQFSMMCLDEYDQETEELVDRTIAIWERTAYAPKSRSYAYLLRAMLGWRHGRKGEALADLRKSMDLAEQARANASGSEVERAETFVSFTSVFEKMVEWQMELGDAGEALAAIERAHARSLLDEMQTSGADLDAGRSVAEREASHARENELRTKIARLETAGGDEKALSDAKEQLYEHYRQQRSTSAVYRNLLAVGGGPPQLRQVQRTLVAGDALLLVYMLGEEASYVAVVDSKAARVERLEVLPEQATALRIPSGDMTASRLRPVFIDDRGEGLLQQLRDPALAQQTHGRLAALWLTLIPKRERDALTSGRYKRLIVVPDGRLGLLPLETLVVSTSPQVQYLLDAGPPIEYGPSVTVLYNLATNRQAALAEEGTKIEPVLTVGGAIYGDATAQVASAGGSTARSSYRSGGGKLNPLPFSGWEVDWVRESCQKAGWPAHALTAAKATEAAVRADVRGRRLVHLACHGLVDQSHGNLFGSLALTPGPNAATDPGDDGFLTLSEIYQLDLKACQLAILSACDTNYGPAQEGEGVWSLSRGFLVAGVRRVVASNWLVDDEAGATLVSVFCSAVAKGEQSSSQNYCEALRNAKRYVRSQEKWQSPYYWGSFVLVGPN